MSKKIIRTAGSVVNSTASIIDMAGKLISCGNANLNNWLAKEEASRATRDSMAWDRLYLSLKKELKELEQEIADANLSAEEKKEMAEFNPYTAKKKS